MGVGGGQREGRGNGEGVGVWDGERGPLSIPLHPFPAPLINLWSKGAASGPGPPLSGASALSRAPERETGGWTDAEHSCSPVRRRRGGRGGCRGLSAAVFIAGRSKRLCLLMLTCLLLGSTSRSASWKGKLGRSVARTSPPWPLRDSENQAQQH